MAKVIVRRSNPTAERSIHFYRIDGGADESGKPRKVDLNAAFSFIDSIPFEDGSGRYHSQSDGSLNCLWVDQIGEISHVQFGLIRRNALPQAESLGKLKNLQLAEEEGLCEVSHVCIFKEHGVVGVEYNFYGPRAPRLADYVKSVARGKARDFRLEALMRWDVAKKLTDKKGVRKLEIRVRRAYVETVREVNADMGNALDAAARGSNAETIGVILAPEPYKRIDLADSMLEFIRRLVGRSDLRENVHQFKASLVNVAGRVDEINLLEDHLITKKAILRIGERSRVLNSDDAFARIEDSFNELREDLLSASGVTVNLV